MRSAQVLRFINKHMVSRARYARPKALVQICCSDRRFFVPVRGAIGGCFGAVARYRLPDGLPCGTVEPHAAPGAPHSQILPLSCDPVRDYNLCIFGRQKLWCRRRWQVLHHALNCLPHFGVAKTHYLGGTTAEYPPNGAHAIAVGLI